MHRIRDTPKGQLLLGSTLGGTCSDSVLPVSEPASKHCGTQPRHAFTGGGTEARLSSGSGHSFSSIGDVLLAKQAILLHEANPTLREVYLSRILEFFGVPWKAVTVPEFMETAESTSECAAFGTLSAVAA